MSLILALYSECHYAEFLYAQYLNAECHYAECRYTERRGVLNTAPNFSSLKAISVVFQESAGGLATDGEKPILDVVPSGLHDRTPIILGSPGNCTINLLLVNNAPAK